MSSDTQNNINKSQNNYAERTQKRQVHPLYVCVLSCFSQV